MKNIIIDCDTGADDALSIMLATQNPEVNLLGITTVSGNAPVHVCTKNTLDVLNLCGRKDVPVYPGESKPLKRSIEFSDEYCGKNGVCDFSFTPSSTPASTIHAVDFICDMANTYDDLIIVSIAPMTNIAKAIQKKTDVLTKNTTIITMAGFFKVNDVRRKSSEWNVFVDPEAYKTVVDSGIKIVSLGVDVTAKLTNEMVDAILSTTNNVYTSFLKHCSTFYNEHNLTPLSLLVDALPLAYVIDQNIAQFYTGTITLTISDNITSDSISFTKNDDSNHTVAFAIDTDGYLQVLLKNLFTK